MNAKIKVKLRDGSSIYHIIDQGVTVIGKKVADVKRTAAVNVAIRHGVLEVVKPSAADKKANDTSAKADNDAKAKAKAEEDAAAKAAEAAAKANKGNTGAQK